MNTIHIRDQAKRMHAAKCFASRSLHALLHAPIFIYPARKEPLTADEQAWFKANLGGGEGNQVPVHLPYPEFILSLPDDDQTLFVFGGKHEVNSSLGTRTALLTIFCCFQNDGHECWMQTSYTGSIKNGVIVLLWRDGKSFPPPADKALLADSINLPRGHVNQFAFDVMSHFSTVVQVAPPAAPGKSVEWRLARTHYCILARKQAVACRDTQRGPSQAEIVRSAGWRRSHFRILSSPKFIHKQGQRVPVKQAWVGPKEWLGLDGKIYKVMLP